MQTHYDLVIAGGGIAGSALAFAARRAGATVLLVELETAFRDRVRGESMHPWGIAEVERLGLLDVMKAAPALTVTYWDTYVGGQRVERRDLAQTSPSRHSGLNTYHPELQTALLAAAEAAGVSVRRGTKVTKIEPGAPVSLQLSAASGHTQVTAGLAVIADGRQSPLRKALGITMTGELAPLSTSGVLLEGVEIEEHATAMCVPAGFGTLVMLIPLTRGRVRMYYAQQRARARAHSGAAQVPALIEHCISTGVPAGALSRAKAIGPLATFETTCFSSPDQALPPGIALIGDAAGNVDPVFGCGQSLAMRDARELFEQLRDARGDSQLAAARYHARRRAYHGALLRIESWLMQILFTPSPEGDALRAATLARVPELGIDILGIGPESASDAATEARLFAGVARGSAGLALESAG